MPIPFRRNFVQQIHSLEINFLKWQKPQRLGELLADAGYGLQFADVGEGNDPMQVDAGIPVNQGTSMQAAMPAQNPAPAMQQTPNQPAGRCQHFRRKQCQDSR
mgnify:FL=1